MSRLLTKPTLRSLYEHGIYASAYLTAVKDGKNRQGRPLIRSESLKEVLIDLNFCDDKVSQDLQVVNNKILEVLKEEHSM